MIQDAMKLIKKWEKEIAKSQKVINNNNYSFDLQMKHSGRATAISSCLADFKKILIIKFWKPNLFQRFMYFTGIMKDPRYRSKGWAEFDEVGSLKQNY